MNRCTLGTLLFLATTASALAAELTPAAIFARVSTSIVVVTADGINNSQKQGSGVITQTNRVLTNCHVVKDATSLQVRFSDSTAVPAKLLGQYASLDLCLLEVRTATRPGVDIRRLSDIKPGLRVIAVGNPLGLTASVTEGLVSGVRDLDGFRMIQHSAATSPGSSGGGLFDAEARLLGLTTSSNTSGQNINFAVPAEYSALLSLRSAPAAEAPAPWATFMQLPFGSDRNALIRAFPDATCRPQDAQTTICEGSTEYFQRQAQYSIWLSSRGAYLAYARVYTSDMNEAFSEANDALLKRFKLPKSFKPGVNMTWSIGPNEEQMMILLKCDGSTNCLLRDKPGIMVFTTDDRFKPEKRKEF